jgi:hypothetical protein
MYPSFWNVCMYACVYASVCVCISASRILNSRFNIISYFCNLFVLDKWPQMPDKVFVFFSVWHLNFKIWWLFSCNVLAYHV